jgi:hypothetical protein
MVVCGGCRAADLDIRHRIDPAASEPLRRGEGADAIPNAASVAPHPDAAAHCTAAGIAGQRGGRHRARHDRASGPASRLRGAGIAHSALALTYRRHITENIPSFNGLGDRPKVV